MLIVAAHSLGAESLGCSILGDGIDPSVRSPLKCSRHEHNGPNLYFSPAGLVVANF
jgi:hypothetical protein